MPGTEQEPPRPAGGVQSVHRALDLLEVIAARAGAVTIGEIGQLTGIPLATTHRLLGTLVDRGYVRRTPDRRYALGFRLLPLGASASAMSGAGADRALAALVDRIGETANLAVRDGDRVTYVAQVPGRHSMRMFTEVGRRVDPHCTAVGKALLAELGDDEVRAVVARTGQPRHTAHTLVELDQLLAELGAVRRRGYALDEGEQEIGVRCVAVAVPGSTAQLAVSVSGPTARMSDALVAEAVPALQEAGRHLAVELS